METIKAESFRPVLTFGGGEVSKGFGTRKLSEQILAIALTRVCNTGKVTLPRPIQFPHCKIRKRALHTVRSIIKVPNKALYYPLLPFLLFLLDLSLPSGTLRGAKTFLNPT